MDEPLTDRVPEVPSPVEDVNLKQLRKLFENHQGHKKFRIGHKDIGRLRKGLLAEAKTESDLEFIKKSLFYLRCKCNIDVEERFYDFMLHKMPKHCNRTWFFKCFLNRIIEDKNYIPNLREIPSGVIWPDEEMEDIDWHNFMSSTKFGGETTENTRLTFFYLQCYGDLNYSKIASLLYNAGTMKDHQLGVIYKYVYQCFSLSENQ